MGKYGHWFEYQTDNQLYDRFISADPEKYFEIKWYSMYEQFLKENFGDLLV